jgi:hypothetical protein
MAPEAKVAAPEVARNRPGRLLDLLLLPLALLVAAILAIVNILRGIFGGGRHPEPRPAEQAAEKPAEPPPVPSRRDHFWK